MFGSIQGCLHSIKVIIESNLVLFAFKLKFHIIFHFITTIEHRISIMFDLIKHG